MSELIIKDKLDTASESEILQAIEYLESKLSSKVVKGFVNEDMIKDVLFETLNPLEYIEDVPLEHVVQEMNEKLHERGIFDKLLRDVVQERVEDIYGE